MMVSSTLRVLIVDDDNSMRSSLRRILKLDGYEVDLAESATAALDRQSWDSYFAILLDRHLPDSSAEELLPKIRQLAPEASVLVITGDADLESSIAALRLGAADYLMKPIEPESLRARLRGLASLRSAREELMQRDAQMSFMVEHLPAAAAYVDSQTGAVRFNPVVEKITGYTAAELTTLDECFTRFFGKRAELFRKQYDSNREIWNESPGRLKIHRKDGVDRVIEFRGYRYDNHEVWLLQDVTERDRYDTELRIRDQAIQSANEGVVIADATQKNCPIIFVNRAFESFSGYTSQELVGHGCEMLFGTDPSAEAIQQLKSAISSQSEYRTTLQCLRKDGQPFWNDISIAPVRSGLGMTTHIVAVMNDVSEHRQAQKQLLQSERLAAIGQMVTGLAHESRNALQRAQACLDMLSLDLEDQPEQLDLTNKTRRALQDLHRYYEEVRNYAAPINLELRPVNLAKLWQDTWRNLDTAHGDRDFTLVEPSLDFEPVCSIDSHRIEQVFRNIMENALAACPDPGSLTISCEQASNPNTHQQGLQIRFTDNGPGFEPESAASIFQPFFTTKQKGTGLGMAIAKRIVEAHGGRISVDGSSSPGATIEIFLPAQPVTAMATRSEPVAT